MEGTEVTNISQQQVGQVIEAPVATIARAKEAAKALQSVIASKPKPVVIRGEQYIEFEDWQLLGNFYGTAVQTYDAVPVEINGIRGAKASASLYDIRTGLILGGTGAEAYCMEDEEKWGSSPWYQLASMAQTRAGSKALRNRFAWVVVLAGYRPTPAEEIPDDKTIANRATQQQASTEAQRKAIFASSKEMQVDESYLRQYIKATYGVEHTKDLTKKQASELIDSIKTGNMTMPETDEGQEELIPEG